LKCSNLCEKHTWTSQSVTDRRTNQQTYGRTVA